MAIDRTSKPVLGPDPSFAFPPIDHRAIGPGVQAWTVTRSDVPVVAVELMIPGGSASDPSDRRGLTALMADLLDEGTTTRTALELHEALARLGAELDTDVGSDTTVLSLLTLSRHFDSALELLADVLRRPRFDAHDFARVRDTRVSRIRQMRDLPGALADRALSRELYGDHPYAHTPVGDETSLAATARDEVERHHRERFGLRGLHVVVSGDVERDRALDVVSHHLAAATPVVPLGRDVPDARAEGRGHRIVLVDRPGAVQSEVRVGRIAVARRTPHYFQLILANAVLGGQFMSRLTTNLRETKGYTYGVRSAFDFRRGAGPFVVATSVQTDATADTVSEILRELHELGGARPATDDELARAKASLTRGYPRGFETAEQVARGALMLATHDLPLDYFSRFADHVRAVTIDAVTEVARTYLDPSDMQVVVVGDAEKVGPALDALGLGGRISLDPTHV